MDAADTGASADVVPIILVSKCITFANCRYNGLIIASPLVTKLREYASCIPVCPEVEIGLGVPRPPVRIVVSAGVPHLIQPETGRDATAEMHRFASEFLSATGPVDGAILKARSPSCGTRDAKLYGSPEGGPAIGRGVGLFAQHAADSPTIPLIEDELRLQNMRIHEHFLTSVYAMARLRECEQSGSRSRLYEYHAEHKLLLMAYNQTKMREMGKLIAGPGEFEETLVAYRALLSSALAAMPSSGSHTNVLMHALGYFSKQLSSEEKALFLDMLADYRANVLPLYALTSLMYAWAVRFDERYLLSQRYFSPYPRPLSPAAEQDRQRDYHLNGLRERTKDGKK